MGWGLGSRAAISRAGFDGGVHSDALRGADFNTNGRSIVSLAKTRPGSAEHHRDGEPSYRRPVMNFWDRPQAAGRQRGLDC